MNVTVWSSGQLGDCAGAGAAAGAAAGGCAEGGCADDCSCSCLCLEGEARVGEMAICSTMAAFLIESSEVPTWPPCTTIPAAPPAPTPPPHPPRLDPPPLPPPPPATLPIVVSCGRVPRGDEDEEPGRPTDVTGRPLKLELRCVSA